MGLPGGAVQTPPATRTPIARAPGMDKAADLSYFPVLAAGQDEWEGVGWVPGFGAKSLLPRSPRVLPAHAMAE